MNDVKISIHDSIVQVLPNATKAVQNFYGDQFAEKILSKREVVEDSSSDAESPQSIPLKPRNSPSILARKASRPSSIRFVTATMPQTLPWLSSPCSIKKPNSPRKPS